MPKKSNKSEDDDLDLDELFKGIDKDVADKLKREFRLAAEAEAKRRRIPEEARPRGRTTPIAVRFDEFTLKRLRQLADRRNTGYQTLLKEFVVERLYEEEKREGLIG